MRPENCQCRTWFQREMRAGCTTRPVSRVFISSYHHYYYREYFYDYGCSRGGDDTGEENTGVKEIKSSGDVLQDPIR